MVGSGKKAPHVLYSYLNKRRLERFADTSLRVVSLMEDLIVQGVL